MYSEIKNFHLLTSHDYIALNRWRLYSGTDFTSLNPTLPGYQLGYDEKERCFNITGSNVDIGKMLSYRALGPIINNDINLNQMSITIYSGEYATGTAASFIETSSHPVHNIPTTHFPIKSFVLTGPPDLIPPQDDTVPVFEFFSSLTTIEGPSVCFVVNSMTSENVRQKIHFQNTMQYVDINNTLEQVYTGSLTYFPYNIFSENPGSGVCKDKMHVTIPSNKSKFKESPSFTMKMQRMKSQ
jgi:hypothetical protein